MARRPRRGSGIPRAHYDAMRKAMVPLEFDIQCAIADAARLELADCVEWTHVPMGFQGGKWGGIEWGKLERSGARKGWVDLQFFWPVRCGLFMEVKRPGEEPMPHQSEHHVRLRMCGWQVVIVTSLDEARAAWQAAGIPTKAMPLPGGGHYRIR